MLKRLHATVAPVLIVVITEVDVAMYHKIPPRLIITVQSSFYTPKENTLLLSFCWLKNMKFENSGLSFTFLLIDSSSISYTLVLFKRICAHKWCLHSERLTNHQQRVELVTVQHTVHRHTLSQKLIRHFGALARFPDFRESDGSCSRPCFPPVASPSPCYFFCPRYSFSPPFPSPLFCMFHLCFNLPRSLCPRQTCGNVTWWSWCWRFLCPKSRIVNVTCCCARSGFYWACSTVTS